MYEYVLCPSCGTCIGEIYEIFQLMKEKKIKEYYKDNKTSPDLITFDTNTNVDLTDIFKLLHINNFCCRAKLNMVEQQ